LIGPRKPVRLAPWLFAALLAMGCGPVRPQPPPIRATAQDLEEASEENDLRGNSELARQLEERAIVYYRSVDDTLALARALNRLGNLLVRSGDREGARAAYLEAQNVAHASGHRAEEAAAESNLGALLESGGDLDGAEAQYAAAAELASAAGDQAVLATVLNNQGILARKRGQPDQARELFERALVLDRSSGNRAGEATHLRNLGALEDATGRGAEAVAALEQALAIDRTRESVSAIALDLVALSEARARSDNLETAVNERRRARDIHVILHRPDEIARDDAAIDGWCAGILAQGRARPLDCAASERSPAARTVAE